MEMPLTCLVLLAAIFQGATQEISAVFALEGGSAIFEKMQRNLTTEYDDLSCKMNSSHYIMRFFQPNNRLKAESGFKDRLLFNTTTFSLELKNLQKNDSGLYECEIRWNEKISKLMYTLFVLEPVTAPVLTVVSNWSSSDFCDLVTVSCRGHDLCLTFSCNTSDCTQLGGFPITPTLAVFARDGYIICNHSNKVSWHNVSLDMSSLCEFARGKDSAFWTPLSAALISIGIVAAFVLMCICQNRKLKSTESRDNTAIWFLPRTEVLERTADNRMKEPNHCVTNYIQLQEKE